MITKFGKRFLTSYLSGNNSFSAKELALGIGSISPNAKGNDTKLNFEFYRLPVELSSFNILQSLDVNGDPVFDVDGDPVYEYSIIYKSTIPQDVSGVVSEVGLYPGGRQSLNNFDSKFITSFTNEFNWFDGATNPTSQANTQDSNGAYTFLSKVSDSMVRVDVTSGQTKEYINSLISDDISGYSINDTIAIAYKKVDNNVSKIRVKFYSSDLAYYYVDFTPESGTGDKIQEVSLGNLFSNYTASPNLPDPSSIIKIGVATTATGGATTVYFDAIRINDEDTFDPGYGLISRSVLSTPLIKKPGRPVDIEYKLQLEF
jgi:hypothetical protein